MRSGSLDAHTPADSTVLPAGDYRLFVEQNGEWLPARPITLLAGRPERCGIRAE
ncbi:MAG: hypothetical protein HY812_07720 [Planctomycetes bacterium]|nr:hypothetical protein [Planctomycetota bacterium]